MYDLFKEMERVCERSSKELHDFLDRIDQNKNTISPADLDILCKLTDIAKNSKSAMKKIIEVDEMLDTNQNEYSGNMMYRNEPMWDRMSGRNYSGNSYRGTYTLESGNDYSGRNMRRSYSRGDETRMELEEMLNNTRDQNEAEVIRKILNRL